MKLAKGARNKELSQVNGPTKRTKVKGVKFEQLFCIEDDTCCCRELRPVGPAGLKISYITAFSARLSNYSYQLHQIDLASRSLASSG